MAQFKADVALLTDHRYLANTAAEGDWYLSNILRDDQLLMEALHDLGLSAQRINWDRPDVEWHHFRCAVFRTTWDYFDRFAEFTVWLDAVAEQTQLLNAPAVVRWNMDKHYLADLAACGIPVVMSEFIERGRTIEIGKLLKELGWDEAIIKPCVSGAARHTYRVNADNGHMIEPVVNELLQAEALIVQPFQFDVLQNGEHSLMVFDGRFTHAVHKVPRPGDFRVQDDHGGTVHDCQATVEHIELAERAMRACHPQPIYGRADIIRNNSGQLAIMELELIEPELWLRTFPRAATDFAQAIARALSSR